MSDDGIYLVPYDPNWPSLFEMEKASLLDLLGEDAIAAIEHIGSTAVVGLPAKPVIDIEIVVTDIEVARREFPNLLETLDYVFWAENPNRERLFFVKGMPPHGARRTHHVHVTEGWDSLKRHVAFRDHLNRNPNTRSAYAQLKSDLAGKHVSDREAYTSAKTEFVNKVLNGTL